MQKKTSLKSNIIVRCLVFIAILALTMSLINYFGYKRALYNRYQERITDILRFTAANIDVDDMQECLKAGIKSDKFNQTQVLLDTIKDTQKIDYIYVIIPLNTEPVDNIMNVIAGMSSYEKQYVQSNEVTLGGLTGTDYTAETAAKYYNFKDAGDTITFFEEWADRWGSEYTGMLSLYNSKGEYFAELCVDVPTEEIRRVITDHALINNIIVLLIGAVFTLWFILWSKKAITNPILAIEEKVVALAKRSHNQTNPDALVLEMPDVKTGNELQSLSEAIVKLTLDMKKYLMNALDARDDAKMAQQRAIEMSERATKDSLTGIRNRNAYDAEVKKIEWMMQDGFKRFGIAMIDLNFLKRINDNFGHEKGNEAIINVCNITCRVFTHSPVFRIGGDEFAVIIENEDYDRVDERIAEFEKIIYDISNSKSLQPWERISAAIGWTLYDKEIDTDVDSVFKRADANMYLNKKMMKASRFE